MNPNSSCNLGQRHLDIIFSRLPADGRLLVWGARDAMPMLAKRLPLGATLTWIEHDAVHFQRLAPQLRGLPGVRCYFAPVDQSALASGGLVEETLPRLNAYLPSMLPEPFDVVLIDGLARQRCLTQAIPLLAATGTIFLHDAQRERYDLAKRGLIEFGHCGPEPEVPGADLWWGGLSRTPLTGRATGSTLPLMVNFYTANTGYEAEAKRLAESCRALGLEILSEAVPSQGAWELNCAFKPRFIQRLWQQTKRPVLWLDADAIVRRIPELLRGATCDFAVHKVNRWQFASGTVFVNQTPMAEQLLRRWVARAEAAPKVWDQITLDLAWEDVIRELPLETLWLPDTYTKIFDRPSQFGPDEVVIEHFQASRRLKKEVSGTDEDQRPKTDPIIRAARLASRPQRPFLAPEDAAGAPGEDLPANLSQELHFQARQRVATGDLEAARALLWNAVAFTPAFKEAWILLADTHRQAKETETAASVLSQAARVLPNDAEIQSAMRKLGQPTVRSHASPPGEPALAMPEFACTEDVLRGLRGRVAIVGNATPKSEFGAAIDACDVVIRLNNFTLAGFEELMGTKTSYRCTTGWRDVEPRNQQLEFSPFTATTPESANVSAYNLRCARPLLTARTDVHALHPRIAKPSTGFSLVALCSHLGIPVEVFGFDGFKTPHYWSAQDKFHTTHSGGEFELMCGLPHVKVHANAPSTAPQPTNQGLESVNTNISDDVMRDAARFHLKPGYVSRRQPQYFEDSVSDKTGHVWQPDVYPIAALLARRLECTQIIDVGCGRAQKLAALHPEFSITGVDFGENIRFCRQQYNFGQWIEADFEKSFAINQPPALLTRSVVVCSDVIEHLVDPTALLGMLRALVQQAPVAILSTPERDRARGADDAGPPKNKAHVREWNLAELESLLRASGFAVNFIGLTRSNTKANEMKTIVAVLTAQPVTGLLGSGCRGQAVLVDESAIRFADPDASFAPPGNEMKFTADLASRLAVAQAAINQGDLPGAIRELNEAVQLAPQDPDLRVALGNVHLVAGQTQAAHGCFAHALRLDPAHPEATDALRHAGPETTLLGVSPSPLDEIERQARAALAINPHGIEALRSLASVCLQTTRWPEAAQAAARLLGQKPDDVEALLMLAKCFFKTGDQESTRLALERVLAFDPNHELARENLIALGFPPAPKADPTQELAALIQAGQEAIARGDAQSAIQSLERAVASSPKDPDLMVALAALHLAVGAVEPARRHLAQALLLDPDHTEARRLLLELALGEPVTMETATEVAETKPAPIRPPRVPVPRIAADHKDNATAFAHLQRGFALLKDRKFAEAESACRHYQALIDYNALDCTDNRPGLNPKVSVVIVAYQINDGLIQCLDSLAAQKNPPHEIIVVDNGGNETIHAELAGRPILHVRVGFNVILAEGRNIGIHFARAPIAAFIDDDALAGPHYLESILAGFETFDVHALRGRVLPKTDHPNNQDVKHYDLGALPLPCFNNAEGNSATRVDTWRRFGGQDPLLFGSEGVELSYRIAQELGENATIYWPHTTILHDYAVTDTKKETKNSRHELMREYAEWKHPGLSDAYHRVRRVFKNEADRPALAAQLPRRTREELPTLLARLEHRFSERRASMDVASPSETLRSALESRGWMGKLDAYAAQLRRIEIVRPVAKPDLSVVIIAHEIRPDCLKVLQKLRAETGPHYEVIYVINGSGVPNIDEVRPLVDTLIELRNNTGAYFARNVGAVFAEAPILFFLDDDAIPEDGLIAAHLNAFEKYDTISVRGAIVGKTSNPLNALAKHYHLGSRPFPVQADVEGNTSYRADAFFAVGGWDDDINFGGGGIDLAFRLLTFDADRRRQIYSPAPVVYHDYAKDQQHLTNKHQKQEQSRERLRKKHPRFDALRDSWRTFFGREELLIPWVRACLNASSTPTKAVTQPLITVAIPTYNRARYLEEAVASALGQQFDNFEVVVVDDGSTDDTAARLAKLRDPRVRFVRKEHSGGPATRNRCVAEARGEFVLWLDSDDVLLPGVLATYAAAVAQHPEVDVHYGNLLAADEKLAACEHWTYREYYGWPAALLSDLIVENRIPNGGTLVRRSCFGQVGGFDAAFTRAHDYEFWTRLAPVATFRHVGATVAIYRRHEDSLTKVVKQVDTSFEARIVRQLLAAHALPKLLSQCFAEGVPASHGEARAWLIAALLMIKHGDLATALEYAKRSVGLADQTTNTRVAAILGVISGRSKIFGGPRDTDDFGRLIEQAAKHYAAGQVQPCAQACAKLTELRPDAVETLLLVGLSLRRWANPNDAKTAFHCLVQRQCERAHLDAVTEAEAARLDAAAAHPLAKPLARVLRETAIPNEAVTRTLAFVAEAAGATSIRRFIAGRHAGQTPLLSALLGLTKEELAQSVESTTMDQIARVRAAMEPNPGTTAHRKPGYSFCIITAGQRAEKLAREIASIHALKLPAYEILVGGEVSNVPANVRRIDLADAAHAGRLGRMRNELGRQAQYDHLVVADDDLVFDPGFAAGLQRFGDGYDAMAVRIVNPDGSRFWDWATTGGTKGSVLLEYWDADPNVYITGGFCVLKAAVFDRVLWDEHRGFYEREDVDFATRLKAAGFTIRYNPFCTVVHDDDRYSRVGHRIYQFDHLMEAVLQAHRAGELDEVRRLFPHAVRMAGNHADRKQAVQAVAKQMNLPELLAGPTASRPVMSPAEVVALSVSTTKVKLEINWQGSFLDYGSLSNINRVLTDTLVIQNGASIRRLQTAPVNGKLAKPLQSYRGKLAASSNPNAALTVRHAWPPDWSRPATGKLAVIQPWEFGALPKDWVKTAANVDAFWVPSNYVRQVYVDSGVPAAKVHVLPNGIDSKVFRPDAKPLKLATKKTVKFLFVGGTIYRKGPDVLLKAYVETFTAQDDVCLVIKDFGGGSVYAGQTLEQQIRELQRHANAPEILYLNQDLPPHELPGLYTACDCLAHPYRGEGFGLPVLEAMACGLPVIVTAGGATDDFVPDDAGYKIPARRQVFGCEISGLPLVSDGWLLEPDADAVKRILRRAFANREEMETKGRFASDHARKNWTWNHTANRLAELARECVGRESAAVQATASEHAVGGPSAEKRVAGSLPASAVATSKYKAAPPLKITLPAVARLGHLGPARELLKQRQLIPAWNATLAALSVRPFHPEAYLLLADIAGQAGDVKRSQECVERARELAPNWTAARDFARKHPSRKPAGKTELPLLPSGKEPRLSVCLIAKNEERFLGRCLHSIKSIASQIVVVDTGSTDRTVAIAKEHGAEVHHFTWCDDFSAARNAALEKATGDWVLVLDADEELSPEAAAGLKVAMNAANTISWRLPIVDAGKEAEGCTYVPRLFRNAPGLFYISRVHEQVFSSVEVRRAEWGMESGVGTAKLIHHGYTAEVLRDRNKVERNLRLLELAVEEIPGDPNLLMNFGLELIRSGRVDDGMRRYAEAFAAMESKPAAEITPEVRESLLTQYTSHLMKFSRWQDIVGVLTSSVAQREALSASLCFTLGLAHQELHQWPAAAAQFRLCLERRNTSSFYLVNRMILTGAPRHCLALACWQSGSIAEAAREFSAARAEDPGLLPLQMDAARFEAAHGEPIAALKSFHGVVTAQPAAVDAWVRGARVALSDPDFVEFARDWTVEAVKHHPDNRELIAARGETLLLTQQYADALPFWRQLNGQPRALAARILCELMQDEFSLEAPPAGEAEVSREFLGWYRRLVAYRAAEGVSAVGERLTILSTLLPSAARVLGQVLDQVAVEAA